MEDDNSDRKEIWFDVIDDDGVISKKCLNLNKTQIRNLQVMIINSPRSIGKIKMNNKLDVIFYQPEKNESNLFEEELKMAKKNSRQNNADSCEPKPKKQKPENKSFPLHEVIDTKTIPNKIDESETRENFEYKTKEVDQIRVSNESKLEETTLILSSTSDINSFKRSSFNKLMLQPDDDEKLELNNNKEVNMCDKNLKMEQKNEEKIEDAIGFRRVKRRKGATRCNMMCCRENPSKLGEIINKKSPDQGIKSQKIVYEKVEEITDAEGMKDGKGMKGLEKLKRRKSQNREFKESYSNKNNEIEIGFEAKKRGWGRPSGTVNKKAANCTTKNQNVKHEARTKLNAGANKIMNRKNAEARDLNELNKSSETEISVTSMKRRGRPRRKSIATQYPNEASWNDDNLKLHQRTPRSKSIVSIEAVIDEVVSKSLYMMLNKSVENGIDHEAPCKKLGPRRRKSRTKSVTFQEHIKIAADEIERTETFEKCNKKIESKNLDLMIKKSEMKGDEAKNEKSRPRKGKPKNMSIVSEHDTKEILNLMNFTSNVRMEHCEDEAMDRKLKPCLRKTRSKSIAEIGMSEAGEKDIRKIEKVEVGNLVQETKNKPNMKTVLWRTRSQTALRSDEDFVNKQRNKGPAEENCSTNKHEKYITNNEIIHNAKENGNNDTNIVEQNRNRNGKHNMNSNKERNNNKMKNKENINQMQSSNLKKGNTKRKSTLKNDNNIPLKRHKTISYVYDEEDKRIKNDSTFECTKAAEAQYIQTTDNQEENDNKKKIKISNELNCPKTMCESSSSNVENSDFSDKTKSENNYLEGLSKKNMSEVTKHYRKVVRQAKEKSKRDSTNFIVPLLDPQWNLSQQVLFVHLLENLTEDLCGPSNDEDGEINNENKPNRKISVTLIN